MLASGVQSHGSPQQLAFLDGYLLRVMAEVLRTQGAEVSGLYDYYRDRIENEKRALSPYDHVLIAYIQAHFGRERPFIHAGTGMGTLPIALAHAGYTGVGVEYEMGRFRAACHLRAVVGQTWPEIERRYEVIEGEFPTVGNERAGSDAILIFTNCGAGWDEALTTRMIEAAAKMGDVLLDIRLFGNVRDDPAERDALLARFAKAGLTHKPIPGMPGGTYYHHLTA